MLTGCGERGVESNYDKIQKLQIITTIKPIQAIVAAISNDYVDSFQLIPDYASPHGYNFKPSDIRKVKNADVIFRIDEHMEVMLNPAFENLSAKTELVSLAEVEGVNLLSVSNTSKLEEDDHHYHGNIDFHIWTSPQNTLAMANSIAKILVKLDPVNESYYQQNLESFSHKLKLVSAEISKALATEQNKPYIVFHDSWQYFAEAFNLKKPFVMSMHEGFAPGAKKISEIRDKISTDNIGCIFTSPNIKLAQIKPIIEKLQLKTIEIDVLARKFDLNQDTYVNWLKNMGQQVSACLSS